MDWYLFFKDGFWVLQLIAPILGFIYYQRLKKTGFSTFPFFLLLILVLETVGQFLAYKKLVAPNQALNKFFITPVILLYYSWLYNREIKNVQRRKNIFTIVVVVYLISIAVELFYFSGTTIMFSFSRCIGTVILLFFVIRYFIDLIRSPAILQFKNELLFWISTGCLVYYGITFPYYTLFNFLVSDFLNVFYMYSFVIIALKYFLYTCYITGILCSRKKL